MSKIVQWKRGNTAQTSTYLGPEGEIVVNTDDWSIYVHDGATIGGHIVQANLTSGDHTFSGNVTAENFIANNNISSHQIGLTGNITASHFIGDGSLLTGISVPSLGNVRIYDQTIIGTHQLSDNRPLQIGDAGGNVIVLGNLASYGNTYFSSLTSGRSTSSLYLVTGNAVTGYYFETNVNPQLSSGLVHFPHTADPNVSAIIVTHNQPVAVFYSNAKTELVGNLVITGTDRPHGDFSNAYVQVYSNVNSYSQTIYQNLSSDPEASVDIVLTADDGTDSTYFADFGIGSSTYNYPGYGIIKPRDVYLLAVGNNILGPGASDGTNLILGSTTGITKIFSGAPEDANVVVTFSPDGMVPGSNDSYSLGTSSNQWNSLWVGNVTFADNTTQTTAYQLVGVPTTSKGQPGDKIGMVAYNATAHYYCTQDYTTGTVDIWVKSTWTSNSW
jgi:Major tropism determinant N-terminal domain